MWKTKKKHQKIAFNINLFLGSQLVQNYTHFAITFLEAMKKIKTVLFFRSVY